MTNEELRLLDEIKTKVDQLEASVKIKLVAARSEVGETNRAVARAIEIGSIVAIRAALDTLG